MKQTAKPLAAGFAAARIAAPTCRRIGTLLVAALLAGGCTADTGTDQASAADDEATVFDPMVGTLDKARAAGDGLDARTDRLRGQIDGIGGGQDPDQDQDQDP